MAIAVLRAVALRLWQAARYLGPLVLAAAIYATHLGADGIHGIRVWRLRRGTRKAPERRAEFAAVEDRLRLARTARWAPWAALPAGRRMAVRTAAAAAAFAAFLLVGFRSPDQHITQPAVSQAAGEMPASDADASESIPSRPAFDIVPAAARFRSEVAQTPRGQWAFLTEGPVLAPGAGGEWDDFTVASPWVLKESAGGTTRYRMWYRGCQAGGRGRTCAIGHATSPDGLRWTKSARPVFEPRDAAERRRLWGVAVARTSDRYFLWYSLSPDLFDRRKGSTLHLATSSDGLRWEAAGEVATATEELPYAMEPSVLEDAGTFHLWFVDSLRRFQTDDYAEHEGAPYLMHFTSPDGRQWQEDGRHPLGPMGLGRVRVTVDGGAGAVFRAAAFANLEDQWSRLTSPDGNTWDIEPGSLTSIDLAGDRLGDGGGKVTGATALGDGEGVLAWFVTSRRGGREEIHAGFRKGE